MDKKEARKLAIEELNRVGMGERLDYYPAQLPAVSSSAWPSHARLP